MCVPVFIRFPVKEPVHPRIGKIFHAHRMNFCAVAGGPVIFTRFKSPAQIHLKRVSNFMREHINICRSSVEVGKNERRFISRNIRAISAPGLSFFCNKVHELIFQHEVEKFCCLG